LSSRSELEQRQVWDPLRIHINTDALAVDAERLCTAVGQRRKTGEPRNTADNCPANEDDCGNGGVDCNNCYFTCNEDDVLTTEKRNFLETRIIPDIRHFFASALSVDPLTSPLQVQGTWANCSGPGAPVPPNYNNPGIADVDVVIFLTARTTRYRGNTIAFACATELANPGRRPVVGYINWGPNRIKLEADKYYEQIGVGVHEMSHALGFSSSLFSQYRGGNPMITRNVTFPSAPSIVKQLRLIASPRVLSEARRHFNCSTLEGLELEDDGGSGTASSHWERRVAMYEYMNGVSSYQPIFSRFTFALFEDSGWYQANYTFATENLFGKNQGCSFVSSLCSSWPSHSPYSCDPVRQSEDEGCLFDGRKKAKCNIRTLDDPISDPLERYFSSPNIGGGDSLADRCGLYQYSSSYQGDCTYAPYGEGDFPSQFLFLSFGEHYGPSSRCITAVDDNQVRGPSCHALVCVGGVLMMKIGEIWYSCTGAESQIRPSEGWDDGYFLCPSDSLCSELPNYPQREWPHFISINPVEAAVGDTVTIEAERFGSSTPRITFGLDHGCFEPSIRINGTRITCQVGVRGNKILREDKLVDVTVSDSSGRGDTGFRSFTLLSGASQISFFSALWLGCLIVFLSFQI